MNKTRKRIQKLVMAALFLALCWVLPLLTSYIPNYGSMMLPMHLPVLLSGFILGPWYGLLIGLLAPITRSFIFGMPPLFPTATAMSLELATYGFISGLLFKLLRGKMNIILSTYLSLLIAMVSGRIVYGLFYVIFGLFKGTGYAWKTYINAILLTGIPGIIIQLILIPAIIIALDKLKIFDRYKLNSKEDK